jgi:hypothetical protein
MEWRYRFRKAGAHPTSRSLSPPNECLIDHHDQYERFSDSKSEAAQPTEGAIAQAGPGGSLLDGKGERA